LPKRATKWYPRLVNNKTGENGIGGVVYAKPVEARFLCEFMGTAVFKEPGAKTDYYFVPCDMMSVPVETLQPGVTYKITPYQPKFSDGSTWSVMKPEGGVRTHEGGITSRTHIVQMCYRESPPVSCSKLYATQMAEQLTYLKYGQRTCVQMMLDSGATDWTVVDKDDEDEDILVNHPCISAVLTLGDGQRGRLSFKYMRVPDDYFIEFLPDGSQEAQILAKDFLFDELPYQLEALLGSQCLSTVTIEPAKKASKLPSDDKQQLLAA
jgi:hypothetical protein